MNDTEVVDVFNGVKKIVTDLTGFFLVVELLPVQEAVEIPIQVGSEVSICPVWMRNGVENISFWRGFPLCMYARVYIPAG